MAAALVVVTQALVAPVVHEIDRNAVVDAASPYVYWAELDRTWLRRQSSTCGGMTRLAYPGVWRRRRDLGAQPVAELGVDEQLTGFCLVSSGTRILIWIAMIEPSRTLMLRSVT